MKKAVVCGAGIGGMVSALSLCKKGYEVRIFEKNDYAGGKMGEFIRDGFRFDTGPSLITMPHVIKDLFTSLGRKSEDYIEFEKLESSCRYFWNDGTVFEWYSDHNLLKKELKDVFGQTESDNFDRCIEYGKKFYELSNEAFLEGEFRLRNFITTEGLKNATKFISGRSMNDVANKFFKNPKLKQLFNRFATYNGSSPYLAPQFFAIIPYTEHKFGPWYVKGGIYRIAEALQKLCSEFDIEINFGKCLTRIESSGEKISNLEFTESDGNTFILDDFDQVVANFTSLPALMPNDYLKNDDWSSSGFILFLGIKKTFSSLAHHNIFFSENYEREFIDIFEKRIPANEMTVYVSTTSKNESADAPENCENWFVLVNVPYITEENKWTQQAKAKYADIVIDNLESFNYVFGSSIRDKIQFTEIFSPQEFKEKYGSEFGSIYGLSSNSLFTLMQRPKNRSSQYKNLFFAGGNTHPGGGVPLCFLSGKIVAELASETN